MSMVKLSIMYLVMAALVVHVAHHGGMLTAHPAGDGCGVLLIADTDTGCRLGERICRLVGCVRR